MVDMLYLKDKGEIWSTLKDLDTILYEDGTKKPFELSDVVLTFWPKHKGKPLSEIRDISDLNFLLKVAGEKGDDFAKRCVRMQLLEVSK